MLLVGAGLLHVGAKRISVNQNPVTLGHVRGDRASTGRLGDRLFGGVATLSGVVVIVLVTLIAIFLIIQAIPALANNSANFFTSREWAPGGEEPAFGILEFLWTTVTASTLAMLISVPVGVGVALFITQYAPAWLFRSNALRRASALQSRACVGAQCKPLLCFPAPLL